MNLTSLADYFCSNCFERMSLAWRFASVSSWAQRLFKHFKPISRTTLDCDTYPSFSISVVLNDEFMAGLLGQYQLFHRSHILFSAHTLRSAAPMPNSVCAGGPLCCLFHSASSVNYQHSTLCPFVQFLSGLQPVAYMNHILWQGASS